MIINNYKSQSRNKLIAIAFKEVGMIERYGSGIRRILNICQEYGIIQPKIEEVFNGFRILLFKEKRNSTDVVDNVTDNVIDKRLKFILDLIKQNNQISATGIAEKAKVTKRTVLRDLEKLKKNKQNQTDRNGENRLLGNIIL